MMKKGIILIAALFLFSGCWDNVEIENRNFALVLGIDAADEEAAQYGNAHFRFSAAKACFRGDDEVNIDPAARGQTLIEAIHNFDARSSRKLFLGQAKAIVLSSALLEDEKLFRETLNVIENSNEIDRAITILATEAELPQIINAHPQNETKPGYYLVNFNLLAKKSGGRSFQKNFDYMMAELRATDNTLIPLVQKEDDDIKVEGALVIKNYHLAGKLDGTELRGVLWAEDRACEGAVLTTDDHISMTVRRHRGALYFSEAAGRLCCIIDVRVQGEVKQGAAYKLQSEYERIITQEIKETVNKLQSELEVDAFHLKTALWKQQHSLYKRYAGDWAESFINMEIIPRVRCEII